MLNKWSGWLAVAVASGLFVMQPVKAAEGAGGQLMSAQWLEGNLQRGDVLVLDASPVKLHAMSHSPARSMSMSSASADARFPSRRWSGEFNPGA